MEEHGLVAREVYDERPMRFEYALTERGASLLPVLALADAFGDGPEEQYRDHFPASLVRSRRQTPLLPPRFSSSWMDSMRMPRSIALHMS